MHIYLQNKNRKNYLKSVYDRLYKTLYSHSLITHEYIWTLETSPLPHTHTHTHTHAIHKRILE